MNDDQQDLNDKLDYIISLLKKSKRQSEMAETIKEVSYYIMIVAIFYLLFAR